MKVTAIKTRRVIPPKDDLWEILSEFLPKEINEKTVIAITSKIISICEGSCELESDWEDKDDLIKREATKWLPRENVPHGWVMHTIVNGTLAPTSGIDKSNSGDYYVLLPKDSYKSAEEIRKWLMEKYNLKDVGVVITDSRSVPLRRGTVGVSVGFAGFKSHNDYRKTEDLFGRDFVVAMNNVADGLASSAVLVMGEGKECTPIAVIEDCDFVQFSEDCSIDKKYSSFHVPVEEDIYRPFIEGVEWKEGGKASNSGQ